jgi:hypothetical protein
VKKKGAERGSAPNPLPGLPNSTFGLPCCRWARGTVDRPSALVLTPRCVVVGPSARSLGPRYHGSALRLVVGLFALGLTPPCRPSALRLVVGLFASSFGPSPRRWAVRVGVDPAVSSFGPSPRRWVFALALTPPYRASALRFVLGPAVFVLGPAMRFRFTRRVVLARFLLSCGPCCRRSPVPGCSGCRDLGFRR